MAQTPTIDSLLNLVPERPREVLAQLLSHREVASEQDAHGYSLVHAAASYGHDELLKALINDYHVDANIKDEDGETALFSVEEVRMARLLVELGTDRSLRNAEGQTAAEKLDDEEEQPLVAAYLNGLTAADSSGQLDGTAQTNGLHPPPPVPAGLQVNVGTMRAEEAGEEPDPEFRRRIEELAARADYQDDSGQLELRRLVEDAISDVIEGDRPSTTRRRID